MSPHGKKHHFEVFVHPFEPGLQTRSKLEFSRIVTEEHTVDVVIENGLHVQLPPLFSLSCTNMYVQRVPQKIRGQRPAFDVCDSWLRFSIMCLRCPRKR